MANPEGVSNAKDRIKGSLLGLVLIMISFMIIKSINPVLISPNLTPLSDAPGIFYVGNGKQTTCPSSEADTTTVQGDFSNGSIKYRCASPADPKLLVWIYKEKNFKNSNKDAITKEINCDGSVPIHQGNSFKIAFKTPGVYLYSKTGCPSDEGYRSSVILTSGQMPDEFKNTGQGSVEFVNDTANNNFYGIIFHEGLDQSRGSNCQAPLTSGQQDIDCKPIKIKVNSQTLFVWNNKPVDSGAGVVFYSGAYGWDTKGAESGIFMVVNPNIISPITSLDPMEMDFDYSGTGVEEGEQIAHPNFYSDPGSIRIMGNYLVALYSQAGDGYCQVFSQDVVDLNGTEYIGPKNNNLQSVYIIPIK